MNVEQSQHYQLRVADGRGGEKLMHDPYAFPPLLTEFDLYLLGEGKHWTSYQKLGAQLRTIDGVEGVNFAVWAPNASGVSVVGDFNEWDRRRNPLRKHIPSGIWELFVPGIGAGAIYKYQIRHNDESFEKADPYGFAAELPRARPRKWPTWIAIRGATPSGWPLASRPTRSTRPCRSTRYTWEAGVGPRTIPRVAHLSRTGPPTWSTTARSSATRTWS